MQTGEGDDPSPDDIADVVLKQFDELPAKRKPRDRGVAGMREWVPLSGIVAYSRTGMKCLPQSKLPLANGIVLHDQHAEILCIRTLNHHLLQECLSLLNNPSLSSPILRFRPAPTDTPSTTSFQPFELLPDIKLFLYCSEAPCGDASMELTMAAQEDATPWALPSPIPVPTTTSLSTPSLPPTLPGRANFQLLGHIRRKPSRADAPPSLSKSCSDKLSLMQSTSLLSSLTSLFISPSNAYLHRIILPSSQYSESGFRRCFDTRLTGVKGRVWGHGYKFTQMGVGVTAREFKFSRRGGDGGKEVVGKFVSSNVAMSWMRGDGKAGGETLVNGCLQGRKLFDIRGASRICRKRIWGLGMQVMKALSGAAVAGGFENAGLVDGMVIEKISKCLMAGKYRDLKASEILEERRKVKEEVRGCLGGWVRNEGDDEFGLE
ncbi:hypothetical protein CJF30_00009919 [Rutstroemia sp. NJR-2017a BBW]|nr:hypothetical protein CJF30_00009919 [Rutstroemia sp. NJR-2017a BBW]